MGNGLETLLPTLFGLVVSVVVIASMWKVFVKANQPGWGAIIPIYNTYLLIKIAGRPGWWLLLFFLPVINWVVIILVTFDISHKFGKSTLFGIGLLVLPFVFYPILGFGDARYQG